ncbi:MAG TPA: phosphoribosylanthranilate isomerase [Candidatus Binataceae bacterium]|nr:phosphoribosylanthranilate isomerase [Candidatus Binataceae bacterium]
MRVKICGVTRLEDAAAAIAARADMIGLNFYDRSPRYLTIERARAIRDSIGDRAQAVGVFVNAPRDYIEERRRELSLDMLQFSGDEDSAAMSRWPVPVIAAIRIKPDERIDLAARKSDYVLLDAFSADQYGGTGMRLALDSLRGLDLSRVIIAGGLTPENVAEAAALKPYAVDCASGVESTPGIKDPEKVRRFIANAKSAR